MNRAFFVFSLTIRNMWNYDTGRLFCQCTDGPRPKQGQPTAIAAWAAGGLSVRRTTATARPRASPTVRPSIVPGRSGRRLAIGAARGLLGVAAGPEGPGMPTRRKHAELSGRAVAVTPTQSGISDACDALALRAAWWSSKLCVRFPPFAFPYHSTVALR